MRLAHLFPNVTLASDLNVTALCENSQNVVPGAMFFAHAGSKDNGMKYVDDAIMRGCIAIVVPENALLPTDIPAHIPVIRVANTRVDISRCAALFYPNAPKNIVAVTGTSGKTSTTYFVQQLLNNCGSISVSLGTIGIAGAITRDGKLTTPEAPDLHKTLSDLNDIHITHVAMEASSQALAQHRLDHVSLRAAAFTNLSRDHLDYHGTVENYMAAKTRLFGQLLPNGSMAVLNADDATYTELKTLCAARNLRVIAFGKNGADICLVKHTLTHDGQQLDMMINGTAHTLKTKIAGAFQGENLMAAIGLCLSLGFDVDQIMTAAATITAPPGRMEYVSGHPSGAGVYVDYAHKPDALENVLTSMRAHTPGRLVVVFGCGGDRDAGKRPIMGEIAHRLADTVIITDDNPRTEDASQIRAAIFAASPNAMVIPDRAAAIHTAIQNLQPGDNLIIAGKGHEHGQIFATHTDPFDDVAVARAAITAMTTTTARSSSL